MMNINDIKKLGFSIDIETERAVLPLTDKNNMLLEINEKEELSLLIDGHKVTLNTEDADIPNVISAFQQLFKNTELETCPF